MYKEADVICASITGIAPIYERAGGNAAVASHARLHPRQAFSSGARRRLVLWRDPL